MSEIARAKRPFYAAKSADIEGCIYFEKEVEFDCYENRLETGEMLLLCCDGLWSVLEQQKISKILRENPFLKEATAELVAAANKAGGPDNISCILVKRN